MKGSNVLGRLSVLAVILAISIVGVISCYDSVPTAPLSRLYPSPILKRQHLEPLGSSGLDLGPTPGTKSLITIYPFTEGIVVEGKITGSLTITSNPLARYQFTTPLDFRGYSQSDSWVTQCDANATFNTWATNNLSGCSGTGGTWTDTVALHDSVFAVRGNGVVAGTGECGASPCYTYPTSDQRMTLTPIAAGLLDSASTYFMPKAWLSDTYAPQITFFGRPDPTYIHGIATPHMFLEREWHQAQPEGPWHTQFVGYCGAVSLCVTYLREAGMYWSKERVNGVERQDSVAINCATGDSLLDFLASRRRFMDAVDSSRASDPTFSNRKEFVFAIMREPGPPSHLTVLWIQSPLANPCHSPFDYRQVDPLYGFGQVLAIVHVHPTRPGAPTFCPGEAQDTATEGLSDLDVDGMKQFNRDIHDNFNLPPVPWYVIDPVNTYRLMPGQSKRESRKETNTFEWDIGQCHWIRPTDRQANILN